VSRDRALSAEIGDPWQRIEQALAVEATRRLPYEYIEGGIGFNSRLARYARTLVRAAAERPKRNADRLREYTDGFLPRLEQQLAANVPIYPELERLTLSFSLERMREWLGPDHPIIKEALGTASPDERAKALVSGSTLADPKVRIALFEGGQAAIKASKDPMIQLARAIDDDARALRSTYESQVEGPVARAQQAIAEARFKAYGTSIYPDATSTLRLSHGAVAGWVEAGSKVDPFTRLARMYERTTGQPPFALPKRWLDARGKIDLTARANFVTTNDIVGGNSGSPMVNAAGQVVGLVFDGNIHSISGYYWFDAAKNRTVAVHPEFMRTALTQVYPAPRLAAELNVAK
jgi:hypothetical protein